MKKKKLITYLAILAVLAITLPLALTSCSSAPLLNIMKGDMKATYFFYAVNKNANKADSVDMEQVLYLNVELENMKYEQTTTASVINIGSGEDMVSLTHVMNDTYVNGSHIVSHHEYGYVDGMMYSCNRELGSRSQIKSPMKAKEYNRFMAEKNMDEPSIAVGKGYSDTMSCVQNEDGTWTATYENFTEIGMKPFFEMLSGVEFMVNEEHTLKNVRMICNADADLNLTALSMEFLFEENPDSAYPVPEVRIDYTYEGWNNTVLSEPYDLSEFTEVEDVRWVERFLTALQDRQKAEAGSLRITNQAIANSGSQSEKQADVQLVTFDSRDGYTFEARTTRSNYDYVVNYRDGVIKSALYNNKSGNLVEETEEKIRDFEAQSMVQQLMNNEKISGLDIVDAKLLDEAEGLYRFTLGESVKRRMNGQYKAMYGADIHTFEGYVDATIQDGELMEYVYVVTVGIKINNQILEMTASMTVEFNPPADEGATV